MSERTIAIGDIHGCATALQSLINAIDPSSSDTIVTLGDYIDRGPQSSTVIETLANLVGTCQLIPLMGNHELIMDRGLRDETQYRYWLNCGGESTVESYGGSVNNIPQHHHAFLQNCRPFHETDKHIFVHASYQYSVPMNEQHPEVIFWEHLTEDVPPPHISGKKVFVGHTPQVDGEVYDMGHIALIDTFCFGGKWLTAYEVDSGKIWQADNQGNVRER